MEAETPPAGRRRFVAHAYMTFVALSPVRPPKTSVGRLWLESKPLRVPKAVPHSPAEHQRWEMAEMRRQRRFSEKKATGEMRVQLEQIRSLLREWSLGLRRQSISEADVVSHPALIPPIDEDEELEQVESPTSVEPSALNIDVIRPRRRYSTASYLIPQPSEKSIEVTYAEVVELVVRIGQGRRLYATIRSLLLTLFWSIILDATACKYATDHIRRSDYPVDGNVCFSERSTTCMYIPNDS